jgi:hypothetical protein
MATSSPPARALPSGTPTRFETTTSLDTSTFLSDAKGPSSSNGIRPNAPQFPSPVCATGHVISNPGMISGIRPFSRNFCNPLGNRQCLMR